MGRVALGFVLPVAGLVWLAGCNAKLNIEQTKDLSLSEVIEQPIDGYRKDQKITVTIRATNPVDAFVFLDKDRDEAQAAINARKDDKLLAARRKIQDDKIEVSLPANSPATLMISPAGKSAKVTWKVTN